MEDVTPRLNRLQDIIRDCGSALVAFSGGVDSTLVLRVAVETLGDKALAITGRSLSAVPSTMDGTSPRSFWYPSMVVTSTIESLMMIPVIPNSPTTVNILSGTSQM